jgi:glucosamine--fructose-6-phosphate aminotransferase (isomerizing)
MCGIVGYLGKRAAQPILVEGLKRLEYRGYDSAGLALSDAGGITIKKCAGRIADLQRILEGSPGGQTVGIAHTRWATHGKPTTANAHPHLDYTGKIAVVHNGIVENYGALKTWLIEQGARFISETDTEVIANLVGYFYAQGPADSNERGLIGCERFEWAVRQALCELQGTYGLAILCADLPDVIIGAKRASPLILGVGQEELILASDAAAVVEHTGRAVYLGDDEMVVLSRQGFTAKTLDNVPVSPQLEQIEFSLGQIELSGLTHYMLKEILEQPRVLQMCMGGRVDAAAESIKLGGIEGYWDQLARARRIILTGCGTAWHAALVGEYLFEQLARLPAETEYASEFRYRDPIIENGTVVIAISQSGETADTLAAVEQAKQKGALVLGVVNAVGSSVARATDAGVYLHVGPEIGVASTKAFTGQVLVLAMLAIELGRRRGVNGEQAQLYVRELAEVPEKVSRILQQSEHIKNIASANISRDNWLFLGRGFNYPVALEGALKLKEISYIHAEGLPAAEMKHGPIALVTQGMPAVFVATLCSQYSKLIGNIQEVKARGGTVIVVASQTDEQVAQYADYVITVPQVPEPLQPLLTVVPLQLLAYHAAVLCGHDVDKPRNLAKSVTVE